jgi:hypothetical protein
MLYQNSRDTRDTIPCTKSEKTMIIRETVYCTLDLALYPYRESRRYSK